MASRNPLDLDPTLRNVWQAAESLWQQRHPALPRPFLTCTHRPPTEQNALYAQGRTVAGARVTNAKGGQSPHNFLPALAFDVAFKAAGVLDWNPRLFRLFAELVAEIAGGKVGWGGKFRNLPDSPHFELANWRTLTPN